METTAVRQPSAVIPIAMSVAALAAVFYHIARFGTAPQPDEGAAAHIWQLLMAGQLPIIAFFAFKWLPVEPKPALMVLGLQLAAGVAAAFPIWWFGW